jgi:hypothetical protein
LVAAGKALFYPDRSWPRLFAVAAGLGIPDAELGALREQVAGRRPDVKRADAIRLLEQLAAEGNASGAPAQPPAAGFDFEPTYFWEQMIQHEGEVGGAEVDSGGGEAGAVSAVELQRHLRVDRARARDTLATALLLYLADEQAARRGLGGDGDVASTADVGAPSSPLLAPDARAELERGRRAIDALMQALPDQVNRRLPAALAHLGQLEPTLIQVRRKQAILRSLGLRAAAPADAGLTLEDLLTWYQGRFGAMAGAPEEHAHALGFASVEEFAAEVVLEYLAARDPAT